MVRLTRTLEYRRARFLNEREPLEALTRRAWAQFPTQAERIIVSADNRSSCGISSRDFGENGFAIHCARYTDGQSVGTIPIEPAPEVNICEKAPDPGENFLNSDLMALVKGNHVICMNCGRNAGALRIYLQRLFKRANFEENAEQFELIRIANPDMVAVIDAIGVKQIDLEVGISEAAAGELINPLGIHGPWQDVKRHVVGAFNAITARDESIEQLRLAERGTVTVSIKVPRGDLQVAKEGLDEFSELIADDDESESFKIHLRNGNFIRPSEISVSKKVRLQAVANSVSVFEAWDEMIRYLEELTENRQIEA